MDTEFRKPIAAGLLYPAETDALTELLKELFKQPALYLRVKMLMVPHAAYKYTGAMAALAYAPLVFRRHQIKKVILLGMSHRVKFNGIAITSKTNYVTPLGNVPIDTNTMIHLLNLPQITMFDEVHEKEHSLELQLPFLQTILQSFSLIPLIIGETASHSILEVLNKLWGGDETVFVFSSNLSHYQNYDTAQQWDQTTSQVIKTLEWQFQPPDSICNISMLKSLITMARQKSLKSKVLETRNSGDMTGIKERVVGYGSFIFY
jgi:AmmeMemoRadiSam system protein B